MHAIALDLPRHDFETPHSALPQNGIYLFFEHGETAPAKGTVRDRIVRVGTHVGDGRFPKRIRQHYGNVKSLGGAKNGSVFRRHVGGALLARIDPHHLHLREWQRQGGASVRTIEELVSQTLRDNFTFACFTVPTAEERLALERGLIALLAQHPLSDPSANWLGRFAGAPDIRRTGLWNTQHCKSPVLTAAEYDVFQRLASVRTS